MSESTGSISDTTGSGFMSGASGSTTGKRGKSINKAPSSQSSERIRTERSSSPMETDDDSSDGESRSRVGSIISVGKFSSDSDDSVAKSSQEFRPNTSNIEEVYEEGEDDSSDDDSMDEEASEDRETSTSDPSCGESRQMEQSQVSSNSTDNILE